MKRPMTVADILNSVEFELIQHTLMQDDVSDGIQRLRAYQAKARTELLSNGKSPSVSSAIDLQFNTNEMLLTLLQVMNQRVEAVQQDFRRAAFLKQHTPATTIDAQSEIARASADRSVLQWLDLSASQASSYIPAVQETVNLDEYMLPASTIDEFITSEPVLLQMDVRQSDVPLLGGLFNRIRRSLHELVLFYVNKVVRQQAEVNHSYAKLLQELVAANQAQAREIQELHSLLLQLTGQQPNTDPQPDSGSLTER